ncbi:MAG: glycosyltransferase family 1 protein [Actinomycetota bacterium]
MKVGVNLLWLVPGQVGGTENYAVRLLGGVADLAPSDVDVALFVLPGFAEAHPGLAARFEHRVAPVDGRRRALRVLAESTWLAARSRDRDLVHHLGGTVPTIRTAPSVLTIHDLQYLAHPEWFSAVKRRYLGLTVPRSVRAADLVTAVSGPAADHVVEAFGVDRPAVVPHVVPELVVGSPPPGLPDRYLVFPAMTYPHKNHEILLDAISSLEPARRPHLVLTGGAGRHHETVSARLADPAIADHVRHLGRLDDATFGAVLAGASGLVFPSRYEGFGVPVVEAMSVGVPVVSSSTPPLDDLVAGVGRLLDPDDVEGWAEAMAELAAGEPLSDIDVAAGRDRADQHRPSRTAEELVGLWRGLHRRNLAG